MSRCERGASHQRAVAIEYRNLDSDAAACNDTRRRALRRARDYVAERIAQANTAAEAFAHAAEAGVALGDAAARTAWHTAARVLADTGTELEIVIFDRDGKLMGRAPFARAHDASRPRKRR